MNKELLVGFAREDITPQEYTTLAGLGTDAKRMANNIMDRLTGTCVALKDTDGELVLMCCIDLLHTLEETVVKAVRDHITEVIDIPADHITVSASHTHSAPSFYDWEDERTARFLHHMGRQLAKAAKYAIADLAPAQVEIGRINLPDMTFKRHYIWKDGTVNTLGRADNITAHVGPGDTEMQLMRFVRKDALDIVMVNWQAHPVFTADDYKPDISADYPGVLRNHIEGCVGCHCVFFQGASGDMVPLSRIPELKKFGVRDYIGYGRTLAEHAVACLQENMQPVNTGKLFLAHRTYNGKVDHTEDYLVEKAIAYLDGYLELTAEEKAERNEKYGFKGNIQAGRLLSRSRRPETHPIELYAVVSGEIAFSFAPVEMFSSTGMFIKKNAPCAMTFICSESNGHNAYLADDAAHDYNICFEVDTRTYQRGAAEEVAACLVGLIAEQTQKN